MKRIFKTALSLAAGVMMLGTGIGVTAQQLPKLPLDPAVKMGKLDNGLTYYIRHNEKPKGQADFYIAQKVGSILENDSQRGLAHFLEHMCFNGTENFPGNSLIDYLESKGVKFGANLNAYTSIDETVYNISNVPVSDESVVDSCLIILHDWADGLLLDPEEIDKERGVIHEEWRRSNVGQMRILENLLPVMYPGSKYGYRLPIGTMEVVDNFPYQVLRDYYETWYRPDQQGIVVVGDIDVDVIEGKIKEYFGGIKMPENAPERVYEPVPDNEETIYAIGADKEQTNAIVMLMIRQEPIPAELKGTQVELVQDYMTSMIDAMLNERFSDITSKADAPLAVASASYGNDFAAKTKDAFKIQALPKGTDVKPALEAAYRETLRAQRGGFTESEYDRARSEYLSRLEKRYNERSSVESSRYVNEYVRNFIDGDAAPGIETTYQMMQQVAPMISVDMINQAFAQMITPNNRVVMVLLPEKEEYPVPTAEELAAIMSSIDAEEIGGYEDNSKTEPLIPELPAPGKITSMTDDAQWGATCMTLSNGVKVWVKQTKFKDNEIVFSAIAKGGTSTVAPEKAPQLLIMPYATSIMGYGTYTSTDVNKYLKGKQASTSLSLEGYNRELSGSTTAKDLATAMELIYATFTELNIDEEEFNSLVNKLNAVLANQEADPMFIFQKDLFSALFSDPRRGMITTETLKSVDREEILNIAKSMVANAADYDFFFVGDIDMDTFKPLVEQYIATLPADAATANRSFEPVASLEVKKGSATDKFTTKMETPQTYVAVVAAGNIPYTSKNAKLASIAAQVMSKRLNDKVREEMGAVYSIGAQGSLSRQGMQNAVIESVFPMKPEMLDDVLAYIGSCFESMQSDVTPDELSKVTEYMVKTATENKEKNGAWLDAMSGTSLNGVDTFNGNVEVLNGITVDDVNNYMKQLMDQKNYRVVILEAE
ncbi:MAG: insulinase family protein [Muribaculaceae bacterium]|nr:insulinase family protein [Muribaculaceae bacterium]